MRCAIYSRYSSLNQFDRSIDDQIRKCRQCADQLGWEVLDGHIYTDRAVSGTTTIGRTGLASLLEVAERRPRSFDYILVDDTSRLSRDQVEQAQIIRDLKDEGIFIYFVADGVDTRDETSVDVLLPVYGIKDALYSRDLAKKTKRGMEGQVLKGYNAGGRTYGYEYIPTTDPSGVIDKKTRQVRSLGTEISTDSKQAAVIRTIFGMYASGMGLKAIAIRLNEQGIDPPGKERQLNRSTSNPTWCPNAIRQMLRNPKYIGDWTWNKHQWTRKRKTGKRVHTKRPREEWVECTRDDLAIIDRPLWNEVQNRITQTAKKYATGGRAPRRNYLLSGLLKCGICGSSLIVSRVGKPENIEYRCGRNWQRGAIACPNNIRVKGREIEDHVLAALQEELLNDEVVELIVEKTNQIIQRKLGHLHDEQTRLMEERGKAAKRVENLVKYISEHGDAGSLIRDELCELNTKMSYLDAQLARTTSTSRRKKLSVDSDGVKGWLNRLREMVDSDTAGARAEIDNVLGELTATPVSQNGETGLLLTGMPKIDGILGVVSGASNLSNSGGRI